jgi:sugar lactone lactonase YvrE
VAGSGPLISSGDGGPATNAGLWVGGICFDSSGRLLISDAMNHRVRRVVGGIISTVAGDGSVTDVGDGVPASSVALSMPDSLAVDGSGNIYFATLEKVLFERYRWV